jgi:hypothetical protein
MSELKSAAAMAVAAQARAFLEHERSELEGLMAKQVGQLTDCMTTGEMHYIGHARRRVRMTEDALRCVERMAAALNQRFPDAVVRHRAWKLAHLPVSGPPGR